MRQRRNIWREIGNPLTLFHEKRPDGSTDGDWSAKRVILVAFMVGYLWHWPGKIEMPDVYLAALILLALAIYALMERVPVAEVLDAIRAIAAKASFVRTLTATKDMTQPVGKPPVPAPVHAGGEYAGDPPGGG